MSKRGTRSTRQRPQAHPGASERPAVIHSSLYLPEGVYEALRKVAFDERVKIHDLVLEGLDAVLRRRGLPSVDILRSKSVKKT
jgi:hypothetical protein